MSTGLWFKQAVAVLVLSAAVMALPGRAPAETPDTTSPETTAPDTTAPDTTSPDATFPPIATEPDDTAPAAAGPPAAGTIKPGDLIVTGFPGAILASQALAPGVDPVDRTLIDPNGPSLRVFDASNLGGAPAGKLLTPPLRMELPAGQIGQVFGMAFDNGTSEGPANLYVAATSAFGLNIVGAGQAPDGKPVRLKAGAPDAVFMEGQFGRLSDSSPGAIYKIDGATGAPSYIADTAFSGKGNSGPGIGGLAFDPVSRSLYASDLDSGLVHRFGLDYNAADLAQFDHGVAGRRAASLDPVEDDGHRLQIIDPAFNPADPATWGFTQPARRVDALAVHDGRLYYAVAEGPEIWSVGLNAGAFGDDPRREVKVKAQKPYPITGITFDAGGRMYLAQRGALKSPFDYGSFADGATEVLRYEPVPAEKAGSGDRWAPEPATYAVGTADDGRAADGGITLQYGYKPDGNIDLGACDATVAMSGDTLTATASGVQINGIDLVRPANAPTQSTFVDYDQHEDDPGARGHVGNVLTLRTCGADSGFPPVEGGDAFPPVDGGTGGDSGGGAFPPVDGGGGAAGDAGGGGETFPPVEDGGDGTTTDDGGGGETAENGGVSINKSAVPGTCTEKGGCTFNIDITNNSGADLPELVVGDELTAGAANLGGAKIEGAPPAPWVCTAPPKFTCTNPDGLANGATVSLPLSFAPAGIGQEKELQNCATLNPEPVPVEVPKANGQENNGLKVEAKAISGSCASGVPCEWEIIATNTGAVPLTGELEVRQGNTIRSAGKNVLPATLQLVTPPASPGTTCKVDENQKIVFCNNPQTTIAPGASQSFKFTVTADAPPGAPIDFFQSDVLVSIGKFSGTKDDPPHVTSAGAVAFTPLTPPAGEQAAPAAAPVGPVCATLPVEQPEEPKPSEAGQISLLKTGVACKDKKSCEFTFAIKNTSANDFDGEVVFDDTFTDDGGGIFGATTINPAPPAPWSCPKNGQQGFTCTAKLKIPANSAAPPLNLTFELPAGVGAIQGVKNCATVKDAPTPSCATLPLEPAPGPGPGPGPQEGAKLTVTKTGPAECSDLGGCDFTIAIKNEGDAPFNGPVVVNEEVTLDGKSLPNTIIVPNETWTCTQGGNSTCTSIPQMIIGPQGTATLRLHVIFTSPTGAKVMQNCASVVGAAAKPCVSANLVQGPKLVIKKERVDAVCDPICTFRITVKNIGNQTLKGPIKIVDFPSDIKSDSGATDIKAEVISAKMVGNLANVTCTKPGNIWCDVNTDLQPGISVTFDLTMAVGITDFAGDNCVLPRDVPAGTVPPVCVAMLGLRPQGPNLLIEKRNASPGTKGADHCELKKECLYIIRVTNNGTSDFTGPIKITDTISGGVPDLLEEGPGGNIGWNCTKAGGAGGFGAPSIDCTIPGAPDPIKPGTFGPLAPGKFIELGISVKPGSTWKNSNTIKNCAELIDTGADMGPITSAKKSCTTQKLDPFKLKIEKTGDQSCKPGGECKFDLNIFNDEQIVHDDPVTVVDNLTGLSSAEIVSITPVGGAQPFPCNPQPTKVPFSCSGHMKLEPGDKNHYTIIIRLPADASAQAFSNCASVGGARSSGETSDPSCHSVQLAPAEPFNLKIDKTGPASCAPGSECAFDLTLTNTGSKAHTGAVTLTDGLSGVDSMSIVSVDPPLPCAEQPKDIPFNCRTGDDFTIAAGASRKFRVTARIPRSAETFTNCAIVAGGKAGGSGPPAADSSSSSCVTVKSSAKTQEPTKPECLGGMILKDDGLCACPPGTTWNGRNCVRPLPPPPIENNAGGGGTTVPDKVCPRSLPIGTYPNCCERNTHFDPRVNPPRGACVRDTTGPGDGGADGVNPGDEKKTQNPPPPPPPPVCKGDRPIGTFPFCCPRSMHFERSAGPRGACVRDKSGPGDGGADGVNPGDDKTTQNPPPRERPACKGDRPVGTFPFCCPSNMHFDRSVGRRGSCVKDGGGGPGTSKGTDEPPPPRPTCKGDRPVGTFPFCCPSNMHFDRSVGRRGSCVKDGGGGADSSKGDTDSGKDKCPAGTIGRFPRCRCPVGMTGRPPNCCPPGTKFEGGKCVRPKPTVQCSGGRIGTPPDCKCPAGTHWARSEQCVEDAKPKPPTPTPTPSKPEPSKGKCTGGRVGTPPNCFCRPPAKFIGHRCRFVPAKPKGDEGKVIVK